MYGFVADTFKEFIDRKKIFIYAGITLFTCFLIMISAQLSIVTEMNQSGMMEQMGDQYQSAKVSALGSFLSFLVILSLFASVSLFPNRLIKGRSEYYMARPYSRASLLINQFVSILIVYGSAIIISTMVAYIVTVVFHGSIGFGIITLVLFNMISYFIWLSIAVFAAIIFGSTSMSLMTLFIFWVAQLLLGMREALKLIIDSQLLITIVDVLYYVFPKTGQLSALGDKVALGQPVESYLPLYSSVIFAVLLFALTIAIFKRKNY